MNKEIENTSPPSDDLREEYDFSQMIGGVRGKYFAEYQKGTNLVLLAPDVAEKFQTSQAVNEALRHLVQEEREAA